MGISASTNVKEIRIDQKDAKWESCPSSASSRRGSKNRSLSSLGRRWINSAESSANNRRYQQLSAALEAAEKRAQDAEQRVRQLERELATLDLRNVELADEATWLRKQLSDRPEVPFSERPPTGTLKSNAAASSTTSAAAACSGDTSDAFRAKQTQYLSKLESQIKLYEEDILKLKTKLSKETQRLQAELEDQKHRSEKEVRSLDNRLIEAHKLNQKYEEVISSQLSPDIIAQVRSEVSADCGGAHCASAVLAAASASGSSGISSGGADTLSQSKSRAQLILELTEQISMQQDKIRHLEDEIVQRDIDLIRLNTMVQRGDDVAALSAAVRKGSRASAASTGRITGATTIRAANMSGTSRKTTQSEPGTAVQPTTTAVVANEDEIEALLNNPAILYGQESDDESGKRVEIEKSKDDDEQRVSVNLNISQDLQQQAMSASLCSVPTSWRKEPTPTAPPPTTSGSAGLPPSGANPKRIISIVNSVDGNNLGAKVGAGQQRPKTMAGGRQRVSRSPKRQQTTDEAADADEPQRPMRQASADNLSTQSVVGARTHSAPMFAFKPRPSSKQSTQRSSQGTVSSIAANDLPPPIDLEEQTAEMEQLEQAEKKKVPVIPARTGRASSSRRNNADAIEVMSLHEHDTSNMLPAATRESFIADRDSPNATYDDEGDVEDDDDDDQNAEESDQEIRRRFEERWRKSMAGPSDPSEDSDTSQLKVKLPRPPAGGGVGRAATGHDQRITSSAKSHDSGFLGDSCASTNSLSLWKGRNKRQVPLQPQPYDPLDVDKLLEM